MVDMRSKLCKIDVSYYTYAILENYSVAESTLTEAGYTRENIARTELQSHANMLVAGYYSLILLDTGRMAEINVLFPDFEPMQVPIADAAFRYKSIYRGMSHILEIKNVLYVPLMRNSLIPPFMMREAGIIINDTP